MNHPGQPLVGPRGAPQPPQIGPWLVSRERGPILARTRVNQPVSPSSMQAESTPLPPNDPEIIHGRPEYGVAKRAVRKLTFKRIKASPTLRFYNEVLGTPYQHFGLWDGDPMDLDGLRAAQERYADVLLDWIPKGTQSVLAAGDTQLRDSAV